MAQQFPGCIARLEKTKLLRQQWGSFPNGTGRDRNSCHGGSALNVEFLGFVWSGFAWTLHEPSQHIVQHIPGKAIATTCKFMLWQILPIKAPVSNFKKLCSKGVVWSSSCCGLPEGQSNIWFRKKDAWKEITSKSPCSKLLHLILRLDVAFKYSSMGVLCHYVCTPTPLGNPMHVAGHIVSLNKRPLPTSQRTASSTTLSIFLWACLTWFRPCRLWNRDVLKWKTSDIKTSSRTKLQHMILRQLQLFLSLEKWRPAILSESSVSRDCYWSWKGWSSPSELVLHDSLWSRPRGWKPPAKGATDEVGRIGQWLVTLVWGPGGFGYLGIPL